MITSREEGFRRKDDTPRKVVITCQTRRHGSSWELPEGRIHRHESSIDAAIRDLREDTGVSNVGEEGEKILAAPLW